MKLTPLELAVTIAGSQAELAARISALMRAEGVLTLDDNDVQQQHVAYWKANEVPAKYCRFIEAVTNSVVTRYTLRPDIFGDEPPRPERTFADIERKPSTP